MDEIDGLFLSGGGLRVMGDGVIVVDVEAGCPVDTQVAPEPIIEGIEAADEITHKDEAQDVAPHPERILVLDPEQFPVIFVATRQSHADLQAVVETIPGYDIPVVGAAQPLNIAVFGTKEIEITLLRAQHKKLSTDMIHVFPEVEELARRKRRIVGIER